MIKFELLNKNKNTRNPVSSTVSKSAFQSLKLSDEVGGLNNCGFLTLYNEKIDMCN